MTGHATLLRSLLPPVSYDPSGPRLAAALDAEGMTLDAALALSVRAVMGINPFRAQEWMEDWERVYGLPDPCAREGRTLQERISALAVAVQEQGGISRGYFVRLAAMLGYVVTIREHVPFRAGSRAGDALTNGDWQWAWTLQAPAVTTHRFRAGRSAAGEPLAFWGDEVLECAIRRLAPAHTVVLFAYGPRLATATHG